MLQLISFAFVIIFLSQTWAGDVGTEEIDRIRAFPEQVKYDQQFEQQRLSDLAETKKEQQEWRRQLDQDLVVDRQEKVQQEKVVEESGPDYEAYVDDSLKRSLLEEQRQIAYAEREHQEEELLKHRPGVSEEVEYSLDEHSPRVEWKKRKFTETSGASEGGSSNFNSSEPLRPAPSGGYGGGSPPPVPYEPQNWQQPPPPPPPPPTMFDEENPF